MSIRSKGMLILALLAVTTFAKAEGIYNPVVGWWGFQNGINGPSIPAAPQPNGDILMVDGTSLILQTDGASFICRAGGC